MTETTSAGPVSWDRTGQPHASAALQGALSRDELGHAFLLLGPAGVGQREVAQALAAALNCPDAVGGEGCGVCDTCGRIGRDTYTALVSFEPEGAQHLVASVREDWIPAASRTLTEGRRRVVRIVAADRMNESAQNAFLKALEEPPPSTVWVLEATDDATLLDTILSRCRRLDLTTWPPEALRGRAAELGIPEPRLAAAVRAATGSPDRLASLAARECPECGRVVPAGPDSDACDRHKQPVATVPERGRDRNLAVVGRLIAEGPGGVSAVVREIADWTKQCAAGLESQHRDEIERLPEEYGVARPSELPRGLVTRLGARHKRLQREATQAAWHRFLDEFGSWIRDLLVIHGGGGDADLVNLDHAAEAQVDAARLPVAACVRALADINRCRNAISEFNGQPELQLERVLHPVAAALFATGPR